MSSIKQSPAVRRYVALATTALFGMSALTSCAGGGPEQVEGNGAQATKLDIIVAPVHFEPAYIADRQGIFEDHGLDVEVKPGADAQANFAQALSGDVDIVTTSWTVMATSNAESVPMTAIAANGYLSADGKSGGGVFVQPDSGISSVADLAGKSLGVQGVRSGSDLAVMLAAEEAGIDPKSISQVAIPPAGMQAALESGQVDSVTVGSPFAAQIAASGMKNLGNMQAEFTPNIPSTVWATTDSWLEENAETARKFAAAMQEAVKYYNDPANAEEVRNLTAEISKTDISKIPETAASIQVEFDKTAASKNLADLSRMGYINKEVRFDDIVWDGAPNK